jgi:hypothetical protein
MKSSALIIGCLIVTFVLAGCHNKNSNKNNTQGKTTFSQGNANKNKINTANKVKPDSSDYVAHMSGQNEVPNSVKTQATGTAYYRLNKDSTKLMYTIKLKNAKNVTMAHIHLAPPGKNGPIVVWLYPGPHQQSPHTTNSVNGVLASGTITSDALVGPMQGENVVDLIHAIQRDSTYTNVHNKSHPKGFLRGKIQKSSGNMMQQDTTQQMNQ